MPLKSTASSPQRQPVPILILQSFSTAHLAAIKLSAKELVARITALGRVTTFTSMTVNNCAAPSTTPVPTHPTRLVPLRITASVNSPRVLSERRGNHLMVLANGLELPLRYRPGLTPSPPFALTLCLYHLTSVFNSFPGYLKVPYHVACLALHRQYVETEMYGKLVAQARARTPPMGPNKIGMVAGRHEKARESVCHGPRKR